MVVVLHFIYYVMEHNNISILQLDYGKKKLLAKHPYIKKQIN